MGRNTKLGAGAISDLNRLGLSEFKWQLGTELSEPKNLKDKNIDQNSTDENFLSYIDYHLKGGAAAANTDTGVIVLKTQSGNCFEKTNIGTQTIFAPVQTANGLDLDGDNTNDEGFALTMGLARYYAKHAYVVGTDKFYFETKTYITDVSETDTLVIGFRKAEAHQAAYDNYDEMCAANVNAGNLIWETILNNGATVKVDTNVNVADTNYIKIRWEYDHTVGLSSAIALANSIKAVYTRHIANTAQHTTAADATNVITAADASDLTTLIALVTDLLTQYDAHEGDSELAALWVYHAAQETGDDSLVSAVAPTTLSQCIARLNDLKTKFKGHDDDATSHGVASQFPISVGYASAATLKYAVNTATFSTYDNSGHGFCFDLNEVVIPFIQFLHNGASACNPVVSSWKVGNL